MISHKRFCKFVLMCHLSKIQSIFFTLAFLGCLDVFSQDPQFTQFFANPLYTNPSLAGATGMTRIVLNYRRQWPKIPGGFSTYSASIDTYIPKIRSGLGLILFKDVAVSSRLSTTFANLIYSYNVKLNDIFRLRFGISSAITMRSIDQSKLIFKDQILNQTEYSTIEKTISDFVVYPDFGFSTLASVKNLWLGFSVDHLFKPDQSLLLAESRIPRKYSFYGGMRFKKSYNTASGFDNVRSLSILALFKHQGNFDQLNAGIYYHDMSMIFGTFYRSIPFKSNADKSINNDALIFLVAFKTHLYYIGYSFDYTLSKLMGGTGGAHEVALIYTFGTTKGMPKKISNTNPKCPEFDE